MMTTATESTWDSHETAYNGRPVVEYTTKSHDGTSWKMIQLSWGGWSLSRWSDDAGSMHVKTQWDSLSVDGAKDWADKIVDAWNG